MAICRIVHGKFSIAACLRINIDPKKTRRRRVGDYKFYAYQKKKSNQKSVNISMTRKTKHAHICSMAKMLILQTTLSKRTKEKVPESELANGT